MRHAALVATGSYTPEHEMPNSVLEARFAESAPGFIEKIEAVSGIRTRWYAPDDWVTSDLAVRAAEQAMARAGLKAQDIDLILVGTDTPDFITPSTSVVVQHKLGASGAGTFDIGCACASFPTALLTAASMIAAQPWMNNVLVIGAYLMHRLADPNDPMVFFYGDGAGAAILQPSQEPGIMQGAFLADGSYSKHWGIFAGGTAEPASEAAVREGRTQVRMPIKFPREVNDEGWPKLVKEVTERNQIGVDDIDLAIFTQVRKSTILDAGKRTGIPETKLHMVMDKFGYTGSACIPMALDDALQNKVAGPGDQLILVGSGVGYNQAAVAVQLTEAIR